MKTHFRKLQNPNYVGSWDLADSDGKYNEKVVTIELVKKETVHDGRGGSEECTVVYLKETKPMVANSTNLRSIARICGSPYIEDWQGNQITLFVSKVKAFGEMHDAIRVKKSATDAKKQTNTLTPQRFSDAITAIKEGKTTADKVRNSFTLTPEQDEQLKSIG